MEWNTIAQFHLRPPQGALAREPYVQQRYNEFIQCLGRHNINIGDYLARYLFFDGNSPSDEGRPYTFVPNRFPYAVAFNISHWLFWINPRWEQKNGMMPIRAVIEKCEELTAGRAGPNGKFILFENNPSNRSVGNIRHFHVFVRL